MVLYSVFSTWMEMLTFTKTRQLVELARPLKTTYHRAFDMSADLCQSMEQVVEAGADRILTSGGASTAVEGMKTLRSLVDLANGRVIVMACGGIDDKNVQHIVKQTGVREIHVGLRTPTQSPMRHRNGHISMGSLKNSEYQRLVVTEERVKRLLRAVSECGAGI